jgi:predicted nucleic acid-binding protein
VTTIAGPLRLVFDTTCLSHFARADRLDVLADLLTGFESFVPHVVREEIRDGATRYPELRQVLSVEWLRIVPLDSLERLKRFTVWTSRVSAGTRNLGEASVLAIAEELDAVAVIDERNATAVGRSYGIEVHGTIWLLAAACRDGKLTDVGASNLVDTLAATGMRLPCAGADFLRYANANGLL